MKIRNGQGLRSLNIGEENLNRVRVFFNENPNATQADAVNELGLSRQAISKHIKRLKKESVDKNG